MSELIKDSELNEVNGGVGGANGPTYLDGNGNLYYTVRSGDCLSVIAERFGTSVNQIVAWNRATYPSLANNANLIQIGWNLRVG